MSESISFLTPTFAGDLDRFRLLRESMRELAVAIPHVAVVQTEDLPAFRTEFTSERGLELVASADVLPPEVERARRRGSGRRPRTPRALALRLAQELPGWTQTLSGWRTQQLVKLAGANAVAEGHWVCLDSDAFFLRHVRVEDMFSDEGHLILNTLVDPGDQQPGPRARSARLLGLDATQLDASTYFVDVPVPMHRGVVRDLLTHIERRSGAPWHQAFLRSNATEYMAYGLFASHLDREGRTRPSRLRMCKLIYDYDPISLISTLQDAVDHRASMAMVHSLVDAPVSELRTAARRIWAEAG